ncbi:MAG: hypothetical protein ABL904_08180 [Hyphomicrobiaceae bacterium]
MQLFKHACCLLLISTIISESLSAQAISTDHGPSKITTSRMFSNWRLIVNRVFLSQLAGFATDHPNYTSLCEENETFRSSIVRTPDGSLHLNSESIKLRLGNLTPQLTGANAHWPFQCTPVRLVNDSMANALKSGWVRYRLPCLGDFTAFVTALSELTRTGWGKSTDYHISFDRQFAIGKFHAEMGGSRHEANDSLLNKQMLEMTAPSGQLDRALAAIDATEDVAFQRMNDWCEIRFKLKSG